MKKTYIIFTLILFLSSPCFGKTYNVTLSGDSLMRYGVDLEGILGIPWVLLPVPDEHSHVIRYQFNGTDQGWILVSEPERYLYKRENHRWIQVPKPISDLRFGSTLFSPDRHTLWIPVTSQIPYKENLLYFDGLNWHLKITPNTDGIRSLWFNSKKDGWAGGDWGQIMRWNGNHWVLKYCPTTNHIDNLFFKDQNNGLAGTDFPHSILQYSNERWTLDPDGSANMLDNMILHNNYIQDGEKGTFDFLRQEFDSIQYNTVRIESSLSTKKLIWLCKEDEVFSHGEIDIFRKAISDLEEYQIAFVHLMNQYAHQQGHYKWDYTLFTRSGPMNRIWIEYEPLLDPDGLESFTVPLQLHFIIGRGIGIMDADLDGNEDVYIIVTDGANQLFLLSENIYEYQSVTDRYHISGPIYLEDGRQNYDEGVSSADADNDGDPDLFVTSLYGPNFFYRNQKGRVYRDDSRKSKLARNVGRSTSGVWGDIDLDGNIDLIVSNEDSSNILYRNNGAGVFVDVTDAMNLRTERGGAGTAFADVDKDGDLDLFIPRRGIGNLLFINQLRNGNLNKAGFIEEGLKRGVRCSDSLSHSTSGIFFDADNDGDLDLYVTSLTGTNRLFENDGRGYFIDITDKSGLIDNDMTNMALHGDFDNDGDEDLVIGNRSGLEIMINRGGYFTRKADADLSQLKGQWISGMALIDYQQDGDLDVYLSFLSNYVTIMINAVNNDRFIKLKIEGTRSNRDAIGAKVCLYSEGRSGEPDHLLGFQEVSGGYGYNSQSSRIIHFGVPDGLPKDVWIRFPSGIERLYPGLSPGKMHELREETGFAGFKSLVWKWAIRTIMDPWNRQIAAILLVFGALLFVVLHFIRKLIPVGRLWPAWCPGFIGTFLVLIFIPSGSLLWKGFIAGSFGTLLSMLAVFLGRGSSDHDTVREETLEKLFLSISNFYHGEWGARKLNRLELYMANLEPGVRPSQDMENQISEAVNDFFRLIVPEIEKILEFARRALLPKNLRKETENGMAQLTRQINGLRVESQLNGPNEQNIAAVRKRINALRENLSAIRQVVYRYFCTDVLELMHGFAKDVISSHDEVTINIQAGDPLPVRIRSADLSQILENLLDNALDAVKGLKDPCVTVALSANADMAFVDVEDNGPGVEDKIIGQLFNAQVTTKARGHGSGLHRAKQVLTKYGGDIYLKENGPDHPTLFRIQLKRVYDA